VQGVKNMKQTAKSRRRTPSKLRAAADELGITTPKSAKRRPKVLRKASTRT
jgi:hypothetical protein